MLITHFRSLANIEAFSDRTASFLLVLIVPLLVTGPFLPDLFLSIFSLIFLFKLFREKNFIYQYKKILIFFLIYCLYLLLLSLISVNILLSLEQSLFYFRFGLFVIFAIYIFEKHKFVENIFFQILFATCFLISIDGIFQFFFGFNFLGFYESKSFGRITGVFNDEAVLGSFLSKVFPLLIYGYNSQKISKRNYKLVALVLVLIAIVISGERTSTFFTFMFIIGYLFFSNEFSIKIKLIYFLSSLIILLAAISFNNDLKYRFINITMNQFKNESGKLLFFTKVHHEQFIAGYKIFKDNKVLGVGTKLYRHYACTDQKYKSEFSCTTHPHNTYIQLLSETGLLGALIIFLIFCYTFYKVFTYSFFYNNNNLNSKKICVCMSMICFLWPIMPTGNFFNNWISILMFANIVFYLRETLRDDI